jgi:hypothetical protein
VSELAQLKKDNIEWQGHRLMVYEKWYVTPYP